MWGSVVKYAVKIAIWAAGHPDVVKQVIEDVMAAKSDITKK